MTRFRAWIAEALSGDVVGEVRLSGGAQFASRFGGGVFSAGVSVAHLVRQDGSGPDWDAVALHVGWCAGGKHTLVLSTGQVTVGEWLIVRPVASTDSGVIRIEGHELDGYPAMRSTLEDYKHTDVEQFVIGRELLVDAFLGGGQDDLNLDVPTPAPSGVLRDIDYEAHQAYYSDLLDEVSQAEDGFEWRVVPSLVWQDGAPLRVDRTVEFGHPTLARESTVVVDHDGPGKRSGNAPRVEHSTDFARYAGTVYGIGSGEGDAQPVVALTDATHAGEGYLARTKHVWFPSVSNIKTLTALTRAELEDAQALTEPLRASLLVAKVNGWPRVGDEVTLDVAPTYAVPAGITGSARLGEVSLTLDSGRAATVDVLASDTPRFPYRRSVGQNLRDLFKGGRLGATGRPLGRSSIRRGGGALQILDPALGPGPRALIGDLPGGKVGIGIDYEGGIKGLDELFDDTKERDEALGERIDEIESGAGSEWNERQDRDIADGRRRMGEGENAGALRGQSIEGLKRRADGKDQEVEALRRRVKALEERAVSTTKELREAERDLQNTTKGLATEKSRALRNSDDIRDTQQKGDILEVLYEEAMSEQRRQGEDLDHLRMLAFVSQAVGNRAELAAGAALSAAAAAQADASEALDAVSGVGSISGEIVDARGGFASLGARLSSIASAASSAQSTASSAQSTASSAQSTANSAASAASSAANAVTQVANAVSALYQRVAALDGGPSNPPG